MIVKTLRDAELALNALERQMNTLLSQATNSTGVSIADVRRIVSQTQRNQITTQQTFVAASQFSVTDIDATPSEGQVIHNLIHLFYGDVRFAKAVRLADGWYATLDGLREWKTDIGFDNPIGGSDPNYQIQWLDSVTPALNYGFFLDPTLGLCLNASVIPLVNITGDLGNTSLRWRKLWVQDIDFSGTITGTIPGVELNTSLDANASATPTVTTSFADLAGATVSLNKDGTWLVTCTIVGSKELNDDEIQGQLVYDSVVQSGIIRMAASSANFIRTTGTRSWVITVSGQPKTAKIQVKKNAGTGTSSVDATNSNIVAVYLTAQEI